MQTSDLFVLAGMTLLGLLGALAAYKFGTKAWLAKFAIRIFRPENDRAPGAKKYRAISGLWGEYAALLMVLVLLFAVNLVTEEMGIVQFVSDNLTLSATLFSIISLIVVGYQIFIIRKAVRQGKRASFCRQLGFGYIPYTFYSIVNFSAIILIVCLIVAQTFEQFQEYQQAKQELEALVLDILSKSPLTTPEKKMVLTEQVYSKVREGASFMVDQINTLVLFVFCSFGAQYLVKHTPIRQVYEEDALIQFDVLVWGSIATIVAYAWAVHFFVYDGFFGLALDALSNTKDEIANGGWEMLKRFNDLFLDLTERRGLTGFMISLTSDRGGLLLALGAASWILDRKRTGVV